jgi:hypothetical protein
MAKLNELTLTHAGRNDVGCEIGRQAKSGGQESRIGSSDAKASAVVKTMADIKYICRMKKSVSTGSHSGNGGGNRRPLLHFLTKLLLRDGQPLF